MVLDQEDLDMLAKESTRDAYRRSPLELAAGVVAALLVAALCWQEHSAWLPAWAGATVVVYGVRAGLTAAFQGAGSSFSLTLLIAGVCTSAALWGYAACQIVGAGSALHTSYVLFAVATLGLFVMTQYAVVIAAVAGFALIALMIPAGYLLFTDLGYLAIAIMLGVYAAVLVLQAANLRRLSNEQMNSKAENSKLVSHLDTRREQIEQLRIALKTNTDKREKAESELRRTAADLGLAHGKAKALADTLQRVSPMDPVTGLANRRRFDEMLSLEWRRSMRAHKNISLILVEVDEYETYAKTYGAQASDVCLKRTAKVVIDRARRAGDLPARLENAKFGLIMPSTEFKDAKRIADEIRSDIQDMAIAFKGAKHGGIITANVGMASMIPNRYSTEKEMVERVDNALYEAKFKGGNTVVVFRALSKMRLERWNPKVDGVLSEGALIQKLMVWGYDATRVAYPAKEELPDEHQEVDIIKAVLSGQLQLTIEGEPMILKPGDCLFIPAGITCSAQVVSDTPVMAFHGETTN